MIILNISSKGYDADVPDNTPLLRMIWGTVGLTGTKLGFGMGRCGAWPWLADPKAAIATLDVRPIRSQLEGVGVMGVDSALHTEITIRDGRILQDNFHQYEVPRVSHAPKRGHDRKQPGPHSHADWLQSW